MDEPVEVTTGGSALAVYGYTLSRIGAEAVLPSNTLRKSRLGCALKAR